MESSSVHTKSLLPSYQHIPFKANSLMNRLFACFSALFLLGSLCGCTKSDESSSSHSFQTYQADGVTIAETSGGSKYPGELFTYTHLLTLQQDPTNPPSLLYRPDPRFVMDEGGRFYVADDGNQRIAVYDEQGHFLRSFGRQGSGPGEFRFVRILALCKDVLSLWDMNRRRTTLFTTSGELLNTLSLLRVPQNSLFELHVFADGTLLALTRLRGGDSMISGWQGWRGTTLTPEGDTLAVTDTPIVESSNTINVPGGFVGVAIYYAGRARLLPVPDRGIFSTTGIEPEVLIYDPYGSLRSIIRLDLPTEPVTAQDRQHVEALLRKQINETDTESRRASRESMLENVRFAPYRAFWNDIQTDDYGYIWLLYPYYPILVEETGFVFRVISPEGEYLGDTKWPIPFGSLSRGHLLTVRNDEETGEEFLEVYRIESNSRGFIYP
jgi:hypothetical protein